MSRIGVGSEYFPTPKSGTELRYAQVYETPFINGRGEIVVRVEGEEEIGGKKYVKVVTVLDTLGFFDPSVTYSRVDSSGVYSIENSSRDFGEYLEFPFPMRVGTTWTVSSKARRASYEAIGLETIETPAGKYENCLKIHFTGSNFVGPTEGDIYRAPGV